MKQPSRYVRTMWRIAYFTFSATVLLAVLLLDRYLPPPAAGTTDITVPDLVGSVYAEDSLALPKDWYRIIVEYRTDDTVPYGVILSQAPAPGSVRRIVPGTRPCELHLNVSAGGASLILPDLIGLDADAARLRLVEMGLHVTLQQVMTNQYSPGQVVEVQPVVGSSLRKGDTVTLRVSTTKTQRSLRVPDVIGTPREVAVAALRRAGISKIKVVYAASALPYDTVISQFPLGNTLVSPSSQGLTLTLSDGSQQPYDEQDEPNDAAEDEFYNEAPGASDSSLALTP